MFGQLLHSLSEVLSVQFLESVTPQKCPKSYFERLELSQFPMASSVQSPTLHLYPRERINASHSQSLIAVSNSLSFLQ